MSESHSIRPSRCPIRTLLSFPAVVVFGCLASCVSMDTSSVEDRIDAGVLRSRPRRMATQPTTLAASSQPASSQAATASSPVGPSDLIITVEDAICLSLENNRSLAVERLNPSIQRTAEQQQLAAFDPVLSGGITHDRSRLTLPPTTQVSEGMDAEAGIRTYLPTGTTLDLRGTTAMSEGAVHDPDSWTSRAELTTTQALLRGAGLGVNLASVRQARLDTIISQYELRGFAQDLVAQVEQTYWDCVLAQRQIEIVTSSLAVAQQQYEETSERIKLEKLAEVELAAAEAEVALRREELINANSALETTRLKLWRLVNPRTAYPETPQVQLTTLAVVPESPLEDVALHVELAMRMRPDLNQARLQIQKNDIELVRTRNGLLPKLDVFITLGGTGYSTSFGKSTHHLGDRNYDVLIGLSGEYPLLNRDARAQHQRAKVSREQSGLALDNLVQLAEVDVRGAYIELKRAQEQVRATAATRRLQETKLTAETEKFRVGKSTSLLVAATQRDLLSSQLSEVEAVVTHLKALVELRRLEGSLLDYRGITCPGSKPIMVDGSSPVGTP